MAYMSQEGYDQLVAELKRLESVERPEISRQIAEARDKGDLSENAEYDAAKEFIIDITEYVPNRCLYSSNSDCACIVCKFYLGYVFKIKKLYL